MTTSGSPNLANGVLTNGSIIVGAGGLLGAKADDIIDDESSHMGCCCQVRNCLDHVSEIE